MLRLAIAYLGQSQLTLSLTLILLTHHKAQVLDLTRLLLSRSLFQSFWIPQRVQQVLFLDTAIMHLYMLLETLLSGV